MENISNKAPTAARILLGLIFTVFGINGFVGFLPQPELNAEAGSFMGALAATGYMFPLIKGTEVVAGLMLLSGRFVPLGLTLLAPVIVNIALFHVVLQPGLPMVVALLGLESFLAYAYRSSFAGVLQGAASPSPARIAAPNLQQAAA